MIPKIIHLIWVGDESKRPNRYIQSWVDHHPGWEIKLWGNEDLASRKWINKRHMNAMAKREWNGVADMMRWEILYEEGGILVDADSECIRPLPEWLLECEAFASWENELIRPGLIAAGYFGTIPGTKFLAALIERIRAKPTVVDREAWVSVGPLHLTKTWMDLKYGNLSILPSHFFMPTHHTGATYSGGGPVYALQEWASTQKSYDSLADQPTAPAPSRAAAAPIGSQVFLFEPAWDQELWKDVVSTYLATYGAEEPVALALLVAPPQPGQPSRADVEGLVRTFLGHVQVEAMPTLLLVDGQDDLVALLAPYQQSSWIHPTPESLGPLRGPQGLRFSAAWAARPGGSKAAEITPED